MMSIHGWDTTTMCGVPVAISKAGVLFATNTSSELHADVLSHQEILTTLQKNHGPRYRKEHMSDLGLVKTSSFGLHLDHISAIVNENIESVVSTFHYTDCKQNRMELQMHMRDAVTGNVNGLLAGLYQDPDLR